MIVCGEALPMEVDQAATSPAFDDFLQSGRTGRRNALPDIRENAAVSTASLPDSLGKLTCSDAPPNGTVEDGQGVGAGSAQGGNSNPKT